MTVDNQWIHDRLKELAIDVGQLRRGLEPDTTTAHRAARIASHIYAIAAALRPSAAEIAALTYPGDPETIDAAIDHVERDRKALLRTLGYRNGHA